MKNRSYVSAVKLFFVVSVAEKSERNSVRAQRGLYAVRNVFLVCNGVLIHKVFTRSVHMRGKVVIRSVRNAPKLAPAEREEIFYIRSRIGIEGKLLGLVVP